MIRRAVLAVLLAAPAALPAGPDPWQALSGPFRREAVSTPPGHTAVAEAAAARRALRSPFLVPAGAQARDGRTGPRPTKTVNRDEAKRMLEETAARIEAVEGLFQGGAVDKAAKELETLNSRISSTVFPDREMRQEAEALAERIAGLKRRAAVRLAFAKLNPQVTFIICAGEGSGKSLAVVNQRIVHAGEALAGGLVVSRITPHEVVFALEGEEIAVGLK